MTLTDIEIKGFRSVRKFRLPLRQLTVLIGGNGVGKTNLYRSLELLHAAARGTLADEIAREGGLGSIFWAGGKNLTADGSFDPMYRSDGYRSHEGGNRLTLEARLELDAFLPTYRIELGFPTPDAAAFPTEAQIKTETIELRQAKRPVALLERKNNAVFARAAGGQRELIDERALASETALSTVRGGYPEIAVVRQELSNWRFFHGFRTDPRTQRCGDRRAPSHRQCWRPAAATLPRCWPRCATSAGRPSTSTQPSPPPSLAPSWSCHRPMSSRASAWSSPKRPSVLSGRMSCPTARCSSSP